MQEVSRVGAQGVTSKSKLLAREMPNLHSRALGRPRGHSQSTLTCGSTITRRVGRDSAREMGDGKCMRVEAMEHRASGAFPHRHTRCVESARAPHRTPAASDATAAPEDNDQARKTTEHGEQRGDGVDAVDPGDPARSGGATNRLSTRRNSQSKWSKEKRLRQQPKQPRATAQSIGAARPGRAPDLSSA